MSAPADICIRIRCAGAGVTDEPESEASRLAVGTGHWSVWTAEPGLLPERRSGSRWVDDCRLTADSHPEAGRWAWRWIGLPQVETAESGPPNPARQPGSPSGDRPAEAAERGSLSRVRRAEIAEPRPPCQTAVKANATLCPPNPNESLTAALSSSLRGSPATMSRLTLGSWLSRFLVAGMIPL